VGGASHPSLKGAGSQGGKGSWGKWVITLMGFFFRGKKEKGGWGGGGRKTHLSFFWRRKKKKKGVVPERGPPRKEVRGSLPHLHRKKDLTQHPCRGKLKAASSPPSEPAKGRKKGRPSQKKKEGESKPDHTPPAEKKGRRKVNFTQRVSEKKRGGKNPCDILRRRKGEVPLELPGSTGKNP